jgi:hypothetical protein
MRQFARPFPLARLSLEARVLYSAFLVFVLVGVGTSVWLYDDDGLGVSVDAVVGYYRGDAPVVAAPVKGGDAPVVAAPVKGGDEGGVGLELPDDAAIDRPLRLEKPARQVVETFHFHAFTMPVLLLILGHIFMMCALSTKTKVATLLLASTSTLLHLLLPPLVRFAADGFAALFAPSAIVMTLTWLVLLLWPLVEMWWPTSAEPPSTTTAASE